jgi:bifunctional DNA-binding transcriptional regulator/antitoxin component of YhaV-PrlF toxin-antitoxin module
MPEIANVKTVDNKLDNRGKIKLPSSVIEELGLSKGNKLSVIWGRNYHCVVILPVEAKLGKIVQERIEHLCNEPLGTER